MKNLILSFAFILVSITSFAQKKSEVGTIVTNSGTAIKEGVTAVHQDIKEAVPTLYNDAKTVISQLAAAMKVGAEHVYYVLVKQQIVNSITHLICYIALLVGIYFSFKALSAGTARIREHNAANTGYYSQRSIADDTTGMIGLILGILFSVAFVIAFFNTIGQTVTGFVNPEYGAITHIIDLINQARQ